MTALNGPSYIIYNDISNTLGKIGLLYISIPLFFFWSVFASTVNPEDLLAAISGPIYTLIIVFAVSGYKTLYPIAIGMGSTRKRFLKSFYITTLLYLLALMLVLNVLQMILSMIFDWTNSSAIILHPGMLFHETFSFLPFYYLDAMASFFIFGFSFFLFALYFTFGRVRFVVGAMLIALPLMGAYYLDMLTPLIDRISNANLSGITVFSILGITGIALKLLAYPLLRNVSPK